MVAISKIKSGLYKELKNYEKESKVMMSLNEYTTATTVAESFDMIARFFSATNSILIGLQFFIRVFIITTKWEKEGKNRLPMKEIIKDDWKYLSLQILSVVSLFFRFGILFSLISDVVTYLMAFDEDNENQKQKSLS